jgi:hypothetical protein
MITVEFDVQKILEEMCDSCKGKLAMIVLTSDKPLDMKTVYKEVCDKCKDVILKYSSIKPTKEVFEK